MKRCKVSACKTKVIVSECSRCGGSHGILDLRELDKPDIRDGVAYTHYATCPTTGGEIVVCSKGPEIPAASRN